MTDQRISHYFHYTDPKKHADRLSRFLAYLAGGHEEWMGCGIDEAHIGRFISSEHYDVFLDLIRKSLIINNIPETSEIHQKFIEALTMLKELVC
jgi:truncated hemoglobin YjbI